MSVYDMRKQRILKKGSDSYDRAAEAKARRTAMIEREIRRRIHGRHAKYAD
jgi:hypothetical protein